MAILTNNVLIKGLSGSTYNSIDYKPMRMMSVIASFLSCFENYQFSLQEIS